MEHDVGLWPGDVNGAFSETHADGRVISFDGKDSADHGDVEVRRVDDEGRVRCALRGDDADRAARQRQRDLARLLFVGRNATVWKDEHRGLGDFKAQRVLIR
jgi:hypothetical protein